MASVFVNVISRADNSGFASASRSMAKIGALGSVAAVGAASAASAISAVAVAGASLGALALPALGAIAAGMDGIKEASKTALPQVESFKKAMSSEFASGMTAGFADFGSVLDTITPQMQGVAKSISGVFNGLGATVKENAAGIGQLATKSGEFVARLGPGLNSLVAKMIQFGASVNVDAIFNAFSQIGTLLRPLVNLFMELSAAAGPLGGGFSILGGIITALTPSLVQIVEALGPALTGAMTALAPAIGQLGGAFASVVAAVSPALPVIAQLVAGLVNGLGPALPAIVAAFLAFGLALKAAKIAIAAYAAIQRAVTIATTIWTGVTWLLSAALWANPITWIVLAVVALIAVIVLIATKTTWFQTAWKAMCAAAVAAWNWIKNAVLAFWNWIVGVWDSIVSMATAAWNWISNAATTAWNVIQAVVQVVIAAITAVIQGVVGFITGAWNTISSAASAVWNGISSVVSTVAGTIGSVISGAIDVVVGVFNTAKSIGEGVFNAISAAANVVAGAIQTIIGFVQSLISAISNISWPSPPGWLTSIFSFDPMAMPGGESAFMTPRWTLQNPNVLMLAGGFPSLSDLGGVGGGRGMVTNIDARVIIEVDGSGIVDPQQVAKSIADALGRNGQTRGLVPAMRLGA